MITIEELKITNDGKNLVIRASVRPESYYTNVYIDKVIIDTEETYVGERPSETPVYTFTCNYNTKHIDMVLTRVDIIPNFREHMFFVYIKTKGAPAPDVPCGMDNSTTLGVTLYKGDIYDTFMSYIKEMNSNCQVPQGFIDQILRYKALNLAIDTGHYTQGIDYYNRWFKDGGQNVATSSNCGCNG